jgi:hypothetical protein
MATPPPTSDVDSKRLPLNGTSDGIDNEYEDDSYRYREEAELDMERRLVRKIDWRLCTIAGILCSLNLIDSGIISSASVTSIFGDLGLGVGDRYVSSLSFPNLGCR